MLTSLLNGDNLARLEIIELFLKKWKLYQKEKKFIQNQLIRIKKIDYILQGLVLLDKTNVFGRYCNSFSRGIKPFIKQKDSKGFRKYFVNTHPLEMFQNDMIDQDSKDIFKKYYSVEIATLNYFYEKKKLDTFYHVSWDNYRKCKKDLYQLYQLDTQSKFFFYNDYLVIIKGKQKENFSIYKLIRKLLLGERIDEKILQHIKENHIDLFYISYFDYKNLRL